MLEVKWKACYNILSSVVTNSFNPCYVGSKMESSYPSILRQKPFRFNPCYVGSKMERKDSIEDILYAL